MNLESLSCRQQRQDQRGVSSPQARVSLDDSELDGSDHRPHEQSGRATEEPPPSYSQAESTVVPQDTAKHWFGPERSFGFFCKKLGEMLGCWSHVSLERERQRRNCFIALYKGWSLQEDRDVDESGLGTSSHKTSYLVTYQNGS